MDKVSVLRFLIDTASNAVLSVSEQSSITTSIKTLKDRMAIYFKPGMIREHFQFGSSRRGTMLPRKMDERSDIDYMIVFRSDTAMPQAYLNQLKHFVETFYGYSEIRQSSPSIVLELNHIKFDLVPAVNSLLGTLQIPNGPNAWMPTNPNDFSTLLEEKNKNQNSLIKPTIRLIKYWNAASRYPFESFILEQWICDLDFWGAMNQREYFFTVIERLTVSSSYFQYQNDEIMRAKRIIAKVRQYESQGMPMDAESEIKKLFRL